MNKPVIIGAGISGLSAANHFVDHGMYPIVIEADSIGRPKVCGEFFSCESIPFLNKWEIPYLLIKKANFNISTNQYAFNLPYVAASTSRSSCESKLADRAIKYGARIFTNTFVNEIVPAKSIYDLHYIKLSTGQIIETNKLIITTSKINFQSNPSPDDFNYFGIKAHFKNINIPNELNMYLTDGAYMGLTYIDDSTVNICCLAKKEKVNKYDSIESFMNNFFESNKFLYNLYKESKRINDNWLTASINKFGKKEVPSWPNAYFIGDAIASIYPAVGNGLAMGLTSGVMVAEHIISNSELNFKTSWNNRYQNRLNYAKLMHSIFISEQKSRVGLKFASLFPGVANVVYKFTRDYY